MNKAVLSFRPHLLAAFVYCLLGFAAVLSFALTSQVAAASAGTCLLTDVQGSAVSPPQVEACSDTFQGGTDAAGIPYDSSKCYEIYQHNGSSYISKAISCSDSRFGGASCATGYIGTPPNCHLPGSTNGSNGTSTIPTGGTNHCGGGSGNASVDTGFLKLGCKGIGNPIVDLLFAIIRFLSIGVGLVIVGSMIYAGIQYTSSRGDPNTTAEAVKRIRANVAALLIFIFAYAMLNYVIPGQIFK